MVTLAEYAAARPEGQKANYYAAGDNRDRLAQMPVVKGVLDRGYAVLLLTTDVDEFTFQALRGSTAQTGPQGDGRPCSTIDSSRPSPSASRSA